VIKSIMFATAALAIAGAAPAMSNPPLDSIDWNSPDIVGGRAGEVELPPGNWCLIYSVRTPGEPRMLTYQRGTDCDERDRVTVEEERKRPD
jgi:hypothetical protein